LALPRPIRLMSATVWHALRRDRDHRAGVLDLPGTAATVAAGVSPTLAAAFDGALVRAGSGKAYVPAGHRGRSLAAVDIAAAQIEFFEDAYQGGNPKLRARLTIGGVVYDLSVPADAARTRWKTAAVSMFEWVYRGLFRQCRTNAMRRVMVFISCDAGPKFL
jgi:hypothetical protein